MDKCGVWKGDTAVQCNSNSGHTGDHTCWWWDRRKEEWVRLQSWPQETTGEQQ